MPTQDVDQLRPRYNHGANPGWGSIRLKRHQPACLADTVKKIPLKVEIQYGTRKDRRKMNCPLLQALPKLGWSCKNIFLVTRQTLPPTTRWSVHCFDGAVCFRHLVVKFWWTHQKYDLQGCDLLITTVSSCSMRCSMRDGQALMFPQVISRQHLLVTDQFPVSFELS